MWMAVTSVETLQSEIANRRSNVHTFNIHGHSFVEKNVANYYGGGIYMKRTHYFHAEKI